MKGQLSAEMLILIAVVLAVVAIAAIQITGAAKEAGSNIQNQTGRINQLTAEAVKSQSGGYCITAQDCQNERPCVNSRCTE